MTVSLRGVVKRFGDQTVLSNVTLDFPDQCTTAIVGESGSGKSTLLQLINAVYRADEGEVEVFGEPIPSTEVELFRRRIGYAVQGAGLFPHMTTFENVTLLARIERWEAEKINERFAYLLDLMGLDAEVTERFPSQISGGQQQRVGLCRALMLNPELLLLDESFSAVDPITRADLHRQFAQAQVRESMSVILVTHDMREAVRLGHRMVIIQGGEIQQADTTDAVLANPANAYVERLLQDQL